MASPRNADRIAPATMRAAGLACVAAIALSACSSKPALPSNFEVIGTTSSDAGDLYTVRDTGTGCEFIAGPNGMLPRNERSADGTAVKQRCVITGDETPAPAAVQQFDQGAPVPAGGAAQPAFVPQGTAAGTDAQEQAVREAIREQTAGAIPPAASSAPTIPPPRGARRPAPQAAAPAQPPQDGVESQLR